MNLTKILLLSFCILSITSCYKDPNISGQYSDEHYLRHKEVDMPVWVRGNAESEVFLFFIHGGPKLSGIEEAISNQFAKLHEKYAVVYYDQRSGGFTHGSRTKNLSEAQMTEDLDVVIDFIQTKYPKAKSLFLMGHSWGGYLGTSYLTDTVRQNKLKGWIGLASAHNFPLQWLAERDFNLDYAKKQIAANAEDAPFWQEATDKLTPLTEFNSFDQIKIVNYFAQIINNKVNENSIIPNQSFINYRSSPAGIGVTQKPIPILDDIAINGNLISEMGSITLPSLLIYGRFDAIVPVSIGENAMQFLGTPLAHKSLVVLEESSHDIWKIELDRFISEIEGFVEKYK
ncbi:MAG: alpha/beta fold hydrolase [Crocinitomicaceae bacterium]